MQVNTRRSGPTHDIALHFGNQERVDIIMIQEPWCSTGYEQNNTKTHPNYSLCTPVLHWTDSDTRPRVLTYVRSQHTDLDIRHITKTPLRDIIGVTIQDTLFLNVYRAPQDPTVLDALEAWTPPPHALVAGDFNAWHPLWQPGITPNWGANRLAAWADTHLLALANTPGIPTHDDGNTLDLVLTNLPLATTTIAEHLHTGSDHDTLLTTIPTSTGLLHHIPTQGISLKDPEDVDAFSKEVEQTLWILPEITASTTDLDKAATALIELLWSSALVTCKQRTRGRSTVWWTEECTTARQLYRQQRQDDTNWQDIQEHRRDFRRVIRAAKAQYWTNQIDKMRTDKDLYRVMGWHKPRTQFCAPPLRDGDELVTAPNEKADLLRQNLLERFNEETDIDPLSPTVPRRTVPWGKHIPLEEARAALLGAGNTTPGVDGITITMLQAAWRYIGNYVREFYQACLGIGHHPLPFRDAEAVMIPKPNRDITIAKGWRPISLLSTIGKGLERLVARRMAKKCVELSILHPQVAGALPKRSATDIVGALTHDVEAALDKRRCCTLVTMDIQGAFDTVNSGRLCRTLREQGWPENLVNWARAFTTRRRARVRFERHTTEMAPLHCGLPQGSPASPILYLCYTELLHRIGGQKRRYGYADDCAILCEGKTEEESRDRAQEVLDETTAWGAENGILFDTAKTEVIHFGRLRGTNTLPVTHGDHRISPKPTMRWLGIHLDKGLTYKRHIETRTATARKTAGHIRGLNKVLRGAPPLSMRRAVHTIVIPRALYGSEVWYPGNKRCSLKRKGDTHPMVNHGLTYSIDKIQTAINNALRGCLPVWKTTPIPALLRESSTPPAGLLLDFARQRHGLRLGTLDINHPLVTRASEHRRRNQKGGPVRPTILTHLMDNTPSFPRPALQNRTYKRLSTYQAEGQTKDCAAVDHKEWMRATPPTHITVYTDGSQQDPSETGFGYVVFRGEELVHQGRRRLPRAEVYDAEVEGARAGLKAALRHRHRGTDGITVCLDNSAVIYGLDGSPAVSSQEAFLDFIHTATTCGEKVDVRWVPGHIGVLGNELADQLAKEGARMRPADLETRPPTYSHVKRSIRNGQRLAFTRWWHNNRPDSYKSLDNDEKHDLTATLQPTEELVTLNRKELHWLIAARTGHGDFAGYHDRFNHPDANRKCSCGKLKTPRHPLKCRKTRRVDGPAPWFNTEKDIAEQLTWRFKDFIKHIKHNDFFTRICQY
ncbi:hypothetical protein CSUB01_12226 [Colletotrichum sublineola]|uniref:Reverse transcriptase n=1 Tax=Colletotrichum sublineola TaxID=1173701 RepID=A0A066XCL4_COLSU|nr:hypothetical protein CSUB01_12226 [Colletotrichum sublineola]